MIDIIVAHKSSSLANSQLWRLLYSIETALFRANQGKLAIESLHTIIVSDLPRKNLQSKEFQLTNITWVIDQKMSGVYSAYEQGIPHCKFEYCQFLGCDDIILETFFAALGQFLQSDNSADIILFDFIHENRGLIRQSTRSSSLVFGNWCQQSLVYRRQSLLDLDYIFNPLFRIQADHDLHIRLSSRRSNNKIVKLNCAAILFGAHGVSSCEIDYKFKQQMHSIVFANMGLIYAILSKLRSFIGAILRVSASARPTD